MEVSISVADSSLRLHHVLVSSLNDKGELMTSDELLGMMQSMDDQELTRETIVKAAFPYPGGKQHAITNILPHIPYTDYFRDVFGGSGAILLARNKVKNEYFNDRFSGVTDFYRCVKDRNLLPRLLEWIHFTPFSREEFIRCRGGWKDVQDPVERAARWYVQVLMSFQAYGRHFGRSKQHNAQFSMKLPNQLKSFWPCHYRLQGVYIENQDWRQMFRDLDHPRAVWYLDPPYLGAAEMYEDRMSPADHKELCERAHDLEGFVALSGYDNPIYNSFSWDEKYSWEARETSNAGIGTETNGRIGTEGSNSGIRIECLWIKDFK